MKKSDWHPSLAITGGVACLLALMACPVSVTRLAAAEEPDKSAVPKKMEHVKPQVHLSVDKLPAGGECEILVRLDIATSWHIGTNPPRPDYMIPTEIEFKGKLGTTLGSLRFPKGQDLNLPDFDEPLSVYEKRVDVRGVLQVPSSAAGQAEEMEVIVKYQACNDRTCLKPSSVKLKGKLPVAAAGEPVRKINEKLFPPAEAP
jgi:uncharacterized protein